MALQVVDLSPLADAAPGCDLDGGDGGRRAAAAAVAASLTEFGCAIVRHPRVSTADNDEFLDLMEGYFSQDTDAKMRDVRPDLHYQVGATPAYVETPRIVFDAALREAADALPPADRPNMPTGPDPKWRFFWRVGERPAASGFAELNAEPVVPQAFPQWRRVMDGWGGRMLDVARTVMHAASVGLGLQPDALTSLMEQGPHLLAPTGSDLGGTAPIEGRVFAGYHYDLNLLTLHGRSRFPGLFVWLRDGRRVPVRVPEGCLFVQAGKQFEWLTGGEVMAGMHEVVGTSDTAAAAAAAAAAGRPTWRVSSTVFSHVASDQVLTPLGRFAARHGAAARYPATTAGAQVSAELEKIKLRKRAAGLDANGGGQPGVAEAALVAGSAGPVTAPAAGGADTDAERGVADAAPAGAAATAAKPLRATSADAETSKPAAAATAAREADAQLPNDQGAALQA